MKVDEGQWGGHKKEQGAGRQRTYCIYLLKVLSREAGLPLGSCGVSPPWSFIHQIFVFLSLRSFFDGYLRSPFASVPRLGVWDFKNDSLKEREREGESV